MDRESGINVGEKKRLRDAISEQVERFLQDGGNITVVEGPAPSNARYRGNSWHGNSDVTLLLDDG